MPASCHGRDNSTHYSQAACQTHSKRNIYRRKLHDDNLSWKFEQDMKATPQVEKWSPSTLWNGHASVALHINNYFCKPASSGEYIPCFRQCRSSHAHSLPFLLCLPWLPCTSAHSAYFLAATCWPSSFDTDRGTGWQGAQSWPQNISQPTNKCRDQRQNRRYTSSCYGI